MQYTGEYSKQPSALYNLPAGLMDRWREYGVGEIVGSVMKVTPDERGGNRDLSGRGRGRGYGRGYGDYYGRGYGYGGYGHGYGYGGGGYPGYGYGGPGYGYAPYGAPVAPAAPAAPAASQ